MAFGARMTGAAAMVAACVIWGLSGIYYKAIAHIPPIEITCHRLLWGCLAFAILLGIQSRLGEIGHLLSASWKQFGETFGAACMIGANWVIFLAAIQFDQATEASLGYFIFPLFAVVLGTALYGERPSRLQWAAIALATFGVLYLSIGLGATPWISLLLAGTFTLYGVFKKRTRAGAVVSVATEALILSPLCIGWLLGVHLHGWNALVDWPGGHFGGNVRDSLMLAGSGLITAGPLVLMSFATKRLGYAEVGLLQFVNPTLQFLVAILVFGEPFGPVQAVAFPVIWAALAVYVLAVFRNEGWLRRASTASSGESTIR